MVRRKLRDLVEVNTKPSRLKVPTLTVYGMQNTHSNLFVIIKGGNISICLGVLEKKSEIEESVYPQGMRTWTAIPKPFKAGARTNRGNGGAGAWTL